MSVDFWLYPVGLALGEIKVSSASLVEKYGPVKEGFLKRTGFIELRHAADSESVLSLAQKALSGWNSSDLGEIIRTLVFVTSTSEFQAPGSASQLQNLLGLPPEILAIDINDACTGFIKGIHVALSTLSMGRSGACLLVVGDTYSRLFDPSNLKVSPLFSDAASAFIVSTVRLEAPSGISELHLRYISTEFQTDGGGAKDLLIHRDGARSEKSFPLGELAMNGVGVFNFVLRNLPGVLRRLQISSGLSISSVDKWFVHQGSRAVVDAVAQQLEISGDELFRAEGYGNVVGSSIPAQIIDSNEVEELSEGSTIGLLGFGVGMTMACLVLEKLDYEIRS